MKVQICQSCADSQSMRVFLQSSVTHFLEAEDVFDQPENMLHASPRLRFLAEGGAITVDASLVAMEQFLNHLRIVHVGRRHFDTVHDLGSAVCQSRSSSSVGRPGTMPKALQLQRTQRSSRWQRARAHRASQSSRSCGAHPRSAPALPS